MRFRVAADIEDRMAKLSPTVINADLSHLSSQEREVLERLKEVSRIIDRLFMLQVNEKNLEILNELEKDNSPEGRMLLRYFMANKGPWDRMDSDRPFIGSRKRSPGGGFYPHDMTSREFERWLKKHPEDCDSFTEINTLIKRGERKGELIAVEYVDAYAPLLRNAAYELITASRITSNRKLKELLEIYADEMYSYFTDKAGARYVNLNGKIDPSIGFGGYEDKMFDYKGAYESVISINRRSSNQVIQRYIESLPDLDRNLPISNSRKFTRNKHITRVSMLDVVALGGAAWGGYISRACSFSSDDKSLAGDDYRSRKVFYRNIIDAKFNRLTLPIAKATIDKEQHRYLSFRGEMGFLMFHELFHTLGPSERIRRGEKESVYEGLEELGSVIEETKADVGALFATTYFIGAGVIPERAREEIYTTFFADTLRVISQSLGINEAHGVGSFLIYNYFSEAGAIRYDSERRSLSIDYDKAEETAQSLLKSILNLQAEGSYYRIKSFFDRHSTASDELKELMNNFAHLPLEIYPLFREA